MFKRRRPVEKWSPQELVSHAVLCLASDPGTLAVHAAIVLHQDPEMLPRALVKEMKADAVAESGNPDAPIDEYVAFCFLFENDDRPDLYVGGDSRCVLKQIDGFPTRPSLSM